jgi:predicted nucleic-acid-binding protein
LLEDNDQQRQKAEALFLKGAKGEIELISSTIVFFEINWVLSSFYNRQKEQIIPVLKKIMEMTSVKFEEREILMKAIEIFGQDNIELEGCYNLAYSQSREIEEFKTFDRKLWRLL